MPVLAFPSTHLPVKDFGGTAADSGLSVATAATGFSTGSPFLSKQSLALKLQRLHTPPSAFPTCSGLRSLTKTQEIAEQKALKDLKGKAAEEKKLAALARKADAQAKRQAQLIFSAEAKAAKAAAKADKARLKLAEAQAGALTTPSSHLHKKSKGVSGTPSSTSVGKAASYQSLQRKASTDNKRVSVFQSPQRHGGLLSGSTFSGSGQGNCDSDDSSARSTLSSGLPSTARGGTQYSSPC